MVRLFRLLSFVVATLCFAPLAVRADLTLPSLFSDGMVLQRQKPIAIWGWAQPGEKVVVKINDASYTLSSNSQGKFQGELPSMEAGGPFELSIEATRQKMTKKISDVLVGEVWLASGQSNMAWTVARSANYALEKEAAGDDQLRVFTVGSHPAAEPQTVCKGSWVRAAPDTVGSFSAAAYFMARKLRKELGMPVGVVVSAVGGTDICAWTALEPQVKNPQIQAAVLDKWAARVKNYDAAKALADYEVALAKQKELAEKAKKEGTTAPRALQKPVEPRLDRNHPANLFNGMIAPLIPYTIRGAIWYQGEANAATAESAKLYEIQLALLITDWRKRFGKGDFPFGYVQLPNFEGRPGWVTIRESMEKCLTLPNTGMIVTVDVGDPKDIHPVDKQSVGQRLSLWAEANVYGRPIEYSGPVFQSIKLKGSQLQLEFAHGNGLKTADRAKVVRGFEVAWDEGKFAPVKATIENNRIVMEAKNGRKPLAIRYAWQANPEVNLQNLSGLPARPFSVTPLLD